MLGSAPDSPGAGRHDFNIVNKDFTTPSTKASLDERSNRKWLAGLAKYCDAAALLHGYRGGLDSWQGKRMEAWRKLFSVMELLTLEGREVPADGRAVIVNANRPLNDRSRATSGSSRWAPRNRCDPCRTSAPFAGLSQQ